MKVTVRLEDPAAYGTKPSLTFGTWRYLVFDFIDKNHGTAHIYAISMN